MNYEDFRPYLTNTPKKAYTIVGLTLLSLAGFGFFAIRPTVVTALRLIKERKDGQAAEAALDRKIAALSQAQVNLANEETSLALLDTKLPAKEEIAQILEDLALEAGKNSVQLMGVKQYSPASADSPNPLKISKISLSLEGEFENLEKTINGLENLPRLCLIRSTGFQVKGTWGGSVPEAIQKTTLQTQLELEFYAYDLPAMPARQAGLPASATCPQCLHGRRGLWQAGLPARPPPAGGWQAGEKPIE